MKRRDRPRRWPPPPWLLPVLVGLALAALTVWAWRPRDEEVPAVREGNRDFAARRFPAALQRYEAAPGDGAGNAGVHMNRGLARFRISIAPNDASLPELGPDASVPEGYERAQDEIRNAARGMAGAPLEDIDARLRARAAYNLGNTYFAQHAWQSAIDAYKEALRLAPGWTDAAWNLELARRRKEDAERPDAGPDAGRDATADSSADAPDAPPPDGGPDAGADGGHGDGGPRGGDGGNGDGGRQGGPDGGGPRDAGGGPGDGATPPPSQDAGARAPPPTSLAPLDQLERNQQSLQQLLLRRRAASTPRAPDDER